MVNYAGLESYKADWIIQKIQKEPTEKTVVFYSFFIEPGFEAVQTKLTEAGIKFTVLDQSLSSEEKTRIIDEYNISSENDISVGNGIILITNASCLEDVVFRGTGQILNCQRRTNQSQKN